ncbi:RraA family protein [Paenibacillus sp. RC67]|uniref:RraA family protein n=1 Tax=Paenibacillus sp. RC67 TaxID=3039392 RepID=UPI0024AD7581|nr:RraA family protein [Paenibacillus sp. RC67]
MSYDIVDRFQQLPTTCISDAMKGMNGLDPHIKPLKEEYRVVGRAITVRMPAGDNTAVLRAIREAKLGDILVIFVEGDDYRAVAGDFVVGMAQSLGIKGIVANGYIRDIAGVKQLHFPVFCRGVTAAASAKSGAGEINVPVSFSGATVHPGDIVVGDADGVVIVPQRQEQEVLRLAMTKLDLDHKRAAEYSGNPERIIRYIDEIIGTSKS